jgi:hypothetical protein
MKQNFFVASLKAAAVAAVVFWAGGTLAAPSPVGSADASIPQAQARITNWVLDDSKGIWVAAGHQWYYGEFLGPCTGIGAHDTVAFKFSPDGSLDRYSQVIVPRPLYRSCVFKSFVSSAAPSHEKAAAMPRALTSH